MPQQNAQRQVIQLYLFRLRQGRHIILASSYKLSLINQDILEFQRMLMTS